MEGPYDRIASISILYQMEIEGNILLTKCAYLIQLNSGIIETNPPPRQFG